MASSDSTGEQVPESGNAQPPFDIQVVIENAKRVITDPTGFYRGMAKSGGYGPPAIFVIVMAVAMGLVLAVLSLFGVGQLGAMETGFASIILMPIAGLIGSFIGGAIMFVIWKLMGSSENYETSYRCVAYAAAIYPIMAVANLIPYVGSIVGIAWGMFLMIVASIEVHGRKRETAYLVFGILGAILLIGNINGERQMRRMQSQIEQFGGPFRNTGDMTPEEAGQALGEFLRGLGQELEEQEEQQN